jgi:hypothetical protein
MITYVVDSGHQTTAHFSQVGTTVGSYCSQQIQLKDQHDFSDFSAPLGIKDFIPIRIWVNIKRNCELKIFGLRATARS